MLPLVLVRIVEPLVLVEIPIDLLDLWHFPAVMLLSLSKAVVLRASKYFGLAAGGELVACIVELLPQLLPDLLVVIPWLVAVEFLPSLGLGRGQHLCMVPRMVSLIKHAAVLLDHHKIIP